MQQAFLSLAWLSVTDRQAPECLLAPDGRVWHRNGGTRAVRNHGVVGFELGHDSACFSVAHLTFDKWVAGIKGPKYYMVLQVLGQIVAAKFAATNSSRFKFAASQICRNKFVADSVNL